MSTEGLTKIIVCEGCERKFKVKRRVGRYPTSCSAACRLDVNAKRQKNFVQRRKATTNYGQVT